MNPRVLLLCVSLIVANCWPPAASEAQGVVHSGAAPRAELVGVNPIAGDIVSADLVSVPADDGGKWQVLLFTGPKCDPCERLKQAFESNANLKALAATDGSGWAHLWIFDQSQASQQFRFRDYSVTTFPTILVTPPEASKHYPYYQVFRREGFDNQPDKLAVDMVTAIRRYAERYPPAVQQVDECCPDGRCKPKPDPTPTPDDPKRILPILPVPLPNFPPSQTPVADFVIDRFITAIKNKVSDNIGWILLAAAIAYLVLKQRKQPAALGPTAELVELPSPQGPVGDAAWSPSRRASVAAAQARDRDAALQQALGTALEEIEASGKVLVSEAAALRAARESLPANAPPPANAPQQ